MTIPITLAHHYITYYVLLDVAKEALHRMIEVDVDKSEVTFDYSFIEESRK